MTQKHPTAPACVPLVCHFAVQQGQAYSDGRVAGSLRGGYGGHGSGWSSVDPRGISVVANGRSGFLADQCGKRTGGGRGH
jgi:hypothetical protein